MAVVVDDACPEGSGNAVESRFGANSRVILIRRTRNGGVGAAVKTGLAKCLELEASVIVKLDADGQMDPSYIPSMTACFEAHPTLAYVKGNRFVNASALARMPRIRLLGNAVLSLMVKFATGYWNVLDPTNGFVAFNGRMLQSLGWENFSDTYFFEISALGEMGLRQAQIGELEMPTIYGTETSSLSIRRVVLEFPPKIWSIFFRRILLQYFLFDINLGSLYLFFGSLLFTAGFAFGVYTWIQTAATHEPRTAGTVMLAVLPVLIGVQLLLNALMYDVQFSPKTVREFGVRAKEAAVMVLPRLR